MTYLFDIDNGITNPIFSFWAESFGLEWVAIDANGEVAACSDLDIPCISELEGEALKAYSEMECNSVEA